MGTLSNNKGVRERVNSVIYVNTIIIYYSVDSLPHPFVDIKSAHEPGGLHLYFYLLGKGGYVFGSVG